METSTPFATPHKATRLETMGKPSLARRQPLRMFDVTTRPTSDVPSTSTAVNTLLNRRVSGRKTQKTKRFVEVEDANPRAKKIAVDAIDAACYAVIRSEVESE